jgi:hypothetical protein
MLPSELIPYSTRLSGREFDLADVERQAELRLAIRCDRAQGTMIDPHIETRAR